MTNLFFQRIQFSGIAPDNHQKKRPARILVAVIGALLILLAVGATLFSSHSNNTASQGNAKPAPLDLFP
jgi:hypothetical protein